MRGTVQADILKEDQGQNTCIFSTEFTLKVMGDIAEYFVHHKVRNFYSVSISGYHIAEAGANPISQLAFTLANGFTFVEAYLARGMHIDDFAPNLSFFFSNGMDPEYTVLGRVARRIWAVAMRERYGANERSQKLKYHVQTIGPLAARAGDRVQRHPHHAAGADRRLRQLQLACTPTPTTRRSPRRPKRACAARWRSSSIINREWGLAKNENPNQGAFIIDELTELVEEAVLAEFERSSERGGVLGAMETGYQRGKIQEESHALRDAQAHGRVPDHRRQHLPQPARRGGARARSSWRARPRRKSNRQLARLADFHARHAERGAGHAGAPASRR